MVVGDLEFSTTTTGQPGSAKKKSTLKVVLNGVFLCHCGTNHWVKVTLVYNGKTTRTEDSARRELRKLKNKKAKDCHAKSDSSNEKETPEEPPPQSEQQQQQSQSKRASVDCPICQFCTNKGHTALQCPLFLKNYSCKLCLAVAENCECDNSGWRTHEEPDSVLRPTSTTIEETPSVGRRFQPRTSSNNAIQKKSKSLVNKINDTLKKLTPNSKDALKDKVFNHREVKPIILEVTADSYQHQIVDNISQFMKRQKGSRDPRTLQLTRHVINMTTNFDDEKLPSERYLTKLLGVSRHQLNVVRKLQSDYGKSEAAKLILNLRRSATRKVDENIVKRAVDFWFSNLRESPCMSDFSTLRIGSKVIEKHKTFLQTEPDEELYDKFIKENPDCKSKISLSYFKNKKRCKLYFAKRLKNRSVCLNPKQVKVRQLWRALQINKVKWMNTFKKSMAATYLAICDKLFKRVNLNFKRDRFANQALLRIGDHIVEYLLPRRCLCPVTSKYCFFNWPKRTSEFLDMIMCPRRSASRVFHNAECAMKSCESCGMGPHTWKAIDPIKCTFVYNDTEDADYEEWVTKPVQTTTPASEDAEANEKPKTELVYEKNVNRRRHELLFKFLNSCQEYVTYNFVGQVMDATIKGVTRDLPPGKIFCSSDYSEVMKNEASEQLQSQYYALKTSRILVIVAMRHAVMEIDGEESTVEHPKYVYENFFFCADGDQCSSQSWVGGYTQYGIRTMMEYYIDLYHGVQLQREKKPMPGVPCTSVEIDAFIISSDNCAEQYKCKHVFVNVSRLMEIISKPRPWLKYKKFVIVWFWAGAGCFKWRHDGAGGWFKNVIRQDLLRNNTKKSKLKGMINGVKEIVEFGNNELAVPEHKPPKVKSERCERDQQRWDNRVRRNHFYEVTSNLLKAEDVKRGAKALQGTQKIHVLRVVGGKPGVGEVKDLFCPCGHCRYAVFGEAEGECEYTDLHENFRQVTFPTFKPADKAVTRPAAKRTKTKRYESDDEDDADDEVLDFAIALSPGSYVAIRDYSNDDLTFAIIKLLDTNPVQLAETELYCYELSDSAGNALCFLPGDECVVGYWCARKHVARGGYQVIDGEKNKFGESEQWDGYPHLYFPKSLILHSGFHMTPYFGTGRSKECVQLSVADRDTILGRIVD